MENGHREKRKCNFVTCNQTFKTLRISPVKNRTG